jgi:hypothetical protein
MVHATFRKAVHECGWIDEAPGVKLYREAKQRIRWIKTERSAVSTSGD